MFASALTTPICITKANHHSFRSHIDELPGFSQSLVWHCPLACWHPGGIMRMMFNACNLWNL